MVLLFLFFNCLGILLILLLRYPPTILPHILPVPINNSFFILLLGIYLIALLFVFIKKWKQFSTTLIELLVFPLTFFFLWARTPFDTDKIIDIVIASIIILWVLIILFKDRKCGEESGFTRSNFLPAIKQLLFPTLIVISISLIWFFSNTETSFNVTRFLTSLITYPVYAFFQLLVFLEIPHKRLRQLTSSNVKIVFVIASLFALIHWPNYCVTIVTFLLMLIWASIYTKYRNIWAISLAFGISATFGLQLLPYEISHNGKVGPSLVNEQIQKSQPGWLFDRTYSIFTEESNMLVKKNKNSNHFSIKLFSTILNKDEPHPYRIKLWDNINKIVGNKPSLQTFLTSSDIVHAEWYHKGKQPESYFNQYYGYLDFYQLHKKRIDIRGWALNTKTNEIPLKFYVFIDGNLMLQEKPNKIRADLNNKPQRFGFQFDIQINKPSVKELRIFAFFPNSVLSELNYHKKYQWIINNK
jgi:membrane protease YdiL (CAAX protease family)